jgi:hypothetical protein
MQIKMNNPTGEDTMQKKMLSLLALSALLLCSACAVNPSSGGDWMQEVRQTPTNFGNSIFDQ